MCEPQLAYALSTYAIHFLLKFVPKHSLSGLFVLLKIDATLVCACCSLGLSFHHQ